MKCKNCGAELNLSLAKDGVVECEYCFSLATLPKETNSGAEQFLHIGEHDLDTGKFHEAFEAYKKAAELDESEPEAYWGMALAEFKVQYLKDGVNDRLQPICHGIKDEEFQDNKYFLKALRYATASQRAVYEKRAKEIDYIRNEFYKLERSGLDYDCFLCVKVTDDVTKERTADYKSADDIYFALRGKGYKPFFSERELGNVTGADYEARILYALMKSECMLVVCSNEEYLNTKWVKNEYTRFLRLVNDEEKESDSVTVVFSGRPIEHLPGKNGKIQGIDLRSLNALDRIVSFVDAHTPEARAKRAQAEDEKRRASESAEQRILELQQELNRLKSQQTAAPAAGFSATELLAMMRKAESEEKEKQEGLEKLTRAFSEIQKKKVRDAKEEEERLKRLRQEEALRAERAAQEAQRMREEAEKRAKAEERREARERREALEKPGALYHVQPSETADRAIYKLHGTCLTEYHGTERLLVIPSEITEIGVCAFFKKKIKGVKVPDSVTRIYMSSFKGCAELKEIYIPLSVTRIDKEAFFECNDALTFYCEAPEKPQDWDKDWNKKGKGLFAGRYKVVWGYKG